MFKFIGWKNPHEEHRQWEIDNRQRENKYYQINNMPQLGSLKSTDVTENGLPTNKTITYSKLEIILKYILNTAHT